MGIIGTTLFLFTLCQSLVLGQETPDKETKEKEENVESGGGAIHQILVGASGDDGEIESVPGGIGTPLEVNLTPSFQNGQLPPLPTAVNNNHLRSDLLGSHHPANHPEYFTADEFRDPSSHNGAQFPRTQILRSGLGTPKLSQWQPKKFYPQWQKILRLAQIVVRS